MSLMKQLTTRLAILATIIFCFGFKTPGNDPIENIVRKLVDFYTHFPQEKIYVHTDKPFYITGETIWFRAYLINASNHNKSTISNKLFVYLSGANDSVIMRLVLNPVDNNLNGSIHIPDSLHEGGYSITAFTSRMLNYDRKFIFRKDIFIGSKKKIEDAVAGKATLNAPAKSIAPTNAAGDDSLDIRFLPEGGNMINGTESTVGFIATRKNGSAASVEGYVKNDKGNRIVSFNTFYDGMGKFTFVPSSGRTYYAVIVSKSGKETSYALPAINNFAYQLSVVDQDQNNIKVRISLGDSLYGKNMQSFLLASSYGKVCFASRGRDMYEVSIPKDSFPEGIAKLTLFADENLPVSERLVFIKHQKPTVDIQTDQSKYAARQLVQIVIKSKDNNGFPLSGDFSIAVTDDRAVPVRHYQENIYTKLLLTDDLKGYISDPGFYFDDKQPKANDALDLLMLTHGWSRYTWNEILQGNYAGSKIEPDSALIISGTIHTPSGQPGKGYFASLYGAQWGTSFLYADYQKGIAADTADDLGRFKFRDLIYSDSTQFYVAVSNNKGLQKNAKVSVDKVTWPALNIQEIPSSINDSLYKDFYQFLMLEKSVTVPNPKAVELAPVNISGVKKAPEFSDKRRIDQFSSIITAAQIDKLSTQKLSDALYLAPGVSIMNGHIRIQGHMTANLSSGNANDPLLVVDGVAMEGADLKLLIDNIPPNTVDFIEVLKGTEAGIYGVRGASGVISVNTRKELAMNGITQDGKQVFYIPGYHVSREFYVPKYDVPDNSKSVIADNRTTIYWKGNLKIDKSGFTNLSFYTSDPVTEYTVVLEGISNHGEIIHRELKISRN
ncbi:MAG: hypothetical protein C5B52_03010 [Bacteroidetes bacterium]|nr:MAG: hypothetical protein C5B52_03010 [Bacteroidota bacterium]